MLLCVDADRQKMGRTHTYSDRPGGGMTLPAQTRFYLLFMCAHINNHDDEASMGPPPPLKLKLFSASATQQIDGRREPPPAQCGRYTILVSCTMWHTMSMTRACRIERLSTSCCGLWGCYCAYFNVSTRKDGCTPALRRGARGQSHLLSAR